VLFKSCWNTHSLLSALEFRILCYLLLLTIYIPCSTVFHRCNVSTQTIGRNYFVYFAQQSSIWTRKTFYYQLTNYFSFLSSSFFSFPFLFSLYSPVALSSYTDNCSELNAHFVHQHTQHFVFT